MNHGKKALQPNFLKYCAAHNLRPVFNEKPGCARILRRQGLYTIEVAVVSNCEHVPGRTGWMYPVIGLTFEAMNDFLAGPGFLNDPATVSFRVKNGEIVGKY